jgi:hypothetical protein
MLLQPLPFLGVVDHFDQFFRSCGYALRVAAWKPKLELLVEVVANHPIEERGVVVRVSTPQTGEQRIPATNKLDVRRHRSNKYPAALGRRSWAPYWP